MLFSQLKRKIEKTLTKIKSLSRTFVEEVIANGFIFCHPCEETSFSETWLSDYYTGRKLCFVDPFLDLLFYHLSILVTLCLVIDGLSEPISRLFNYIDWTREMFLK